MARARDSKQESHKRNPALEHLGVFAGKWSLQATSMSFRADPSAIERGNASFEWLEDGAFLVQHSEVPNTEFPSAIAVIGRDDSAQDYCVLYFDSRGVSRIYEMRLSNNIWQMWRESPGFSQRFAGTLSKDGNTITGRWEKSSDGSNWEHDFDLTYTRVK